MSAIVGDGTPLSAKGVAPGTATATYTLPNLGTFEVYSIVAQIDAAAGASRPKLVLRDKSGEVIATKRQSDTVPAGDTGTATWALRLGDDTSAAAAAGGLELVRSFSPRTAPANGALVGLPFAHFSGATLLSYTNPNRPTIVDDGMYGFTFVVYLGTAFYTYPGSMFAALLLDAAGLGIRITGLALLNTAVIGTPGFGLAAPLVTLSTTLEMLAGQEITLAVSQGSGINQPFFEGGFIQRIR